MMKRILVSDVLNDWLAAMLNSRLAVLRFSALMVALLVSFIVYGVLLVNKKFKVRNV